MCAFSLVVFYCFNLQAPMYWTEEGRGEVYPPQQSHDKRLKTQLGKHFEAFIHITSANIPLANASHMGNHVGKEEYTSCGGGRGLAFNFHLSGRKAGAVSCSLHQLPPSVNSPGLLCLPLNEAINHILLSHCSGICALVFPLFLQWDDSVIKAGALQGHS